MPYKRLALAKADKWRLEQLEAADTARAAVHSGHKCTIDEINTGVTFYLISEDRYRLSQLFDYFEPTVWTMLKHRRNYAAVWDWVCHVCTANEGTSRRWVQCDRCLHWLHYACAGLTRKPRRNFFCCKCKLYYVKLYYVNLSH